MNNLFFKKKNNVNINDILDCLQIKKQKNNYLINDIKELDFAEKNDISFFHSSKYLKELNNTKSKLIVTNSKLKKLIPSKIKLIEVNNVLLSIYNHQLKYYANLSYLYFLKYFHQLHLDLIQIYIPYYL